MSREMPNLSWKKLVWIMMQTRAMLVVKVSAVNDNLGTKNLRGRSQEDTLSNSIRENLDQIPTIRHHRRKHTIDQKSNNSPSLRRAMVRIINGGKLNLYTNKRMAKHNDTDGDSARVDRVVPHTLEDNTGLADGKVEGGKTRLSEHDISSTTSSICCTFHSNTDIGTRQHRGVIVTIIHHRAQMPKPLQPLDNLVLVLREHTGEPIGIHNHLIEVAMWSSTQDGGQK